MPPAPNQRRLTALCRIDTVFAASRAVLQGPIYTASETEWEASSSFAADTFCLDSIHLGATSRSSSGRFIANAATTLFCRSHHTLKLLLERSPRWMISSAPAESPQNSYERSNTSEKKYGTCLNGARWPMRAPAQY